MFFGALENNEVKDRFFIQVSGQVEMSYYWFLLKVQYIKRNLFRIGNKHNLFSFQASMGTPRPDDSDCIDLSKLEELEFQQGIISLKFSKW